MGRRYPLNVVLLGVVAALDGVFIGVITVDFTTESMLLAFRITYITVFIGSAFVLWTYIDFNKFGGFICVLSEIF